MNLRPLLCATFALSALAAPFVYGTDAGERAYTETLLCSDVAPEDAALFEHYFGASAEPVADGWDSENLVQYSSSWRRNKAGKRILSESLMILAEDGSTMRKLFCERFESNPSTRVNFKEQKYCAIVPFVFACNLVRIVEYQDETLYVDRVRFNPQTRRIESIESKSWNRRELGYRRETLNEEEEELFRLSFPENRKNHPSLSWDAEHRVVYSARESKGSGGAYALTGVIKRVAADGSSCRVATKTIEVSGEWEFIDRPCAQNLPMVQPFVFVELCDNKWLSFHIEQFNPETGEYEGTRTRTYDFRSLELMGDIEVLYPSLSVEVN